jgi:hypothetical protein
LFIYRAPLSALVIDELLSAVDIVPQNAGAARDDGPISRTEIELAALALCLAPVLFFGFIYSITGQ